ncbi:MULTISPECIES: 50S ribosomal protein L30 [Meiothermus]|jgi:large subunit ribosomal protein L30|uniref:Large ribosomal subunit protein uL30 n=3 Tax=Meiothermus TaxID=65551 RepID=D3PN24_MEIRD|nr:MULTISPECIES: 50S ribosomal protein L30 [Meiothermus]GIW38787.1 MAG: 50S ribosomal protein L30 [Meiothermus sp.]ADD29351.1 ribosomal protein L30 [Meiothermus ruber DSM 1279]AGK05199.1 50S ribosomal protein L30 [Meiothermus ruber DSM 1279]AWR85783.1 ribosomal protein L30 [Meiothermus taiwanensis WR-220]KIQ54807.1 50S ribosomal protein L30 [Meiothermus taiwanensis]
MATLKVRLVKSPIGYPKDQKVALKVLGLTKMNRVREIQDNPAMRGQIRKVAHLVEVLE